MYIAAKHKINLHSFAKQARKACQRPTCLPVSKAHTKLMFYFLTMYIYCICILFDNVIMKTEYSVYLNNIIKKKLVERAKVGHGSL